MILHTVVTTTRQHGLYIVADPQLCVVQAMGYRLPNGSYGFEKSSIKKLKENYYENNLDLDVSKK